MKISLNSLKKFNERYSTTDIITATTVKDLADKIGGQLGEIEEIIEFGSKYDGIVIAKVISCEDHPNADHLHICHLDDSGVTPDVKRDQNGYVQVVCGAPNVRAGLLVAWLPPGSTVPESYGQEPFVLEARELRGVVSNGMLASPKELALGDSHEGILEIVDNFNSLHGGDNFGAAFGLQNDTIIDIENKMFTHRPDCFGMLGVAREIAGIQDIAFKSPDWYILNPTFPDIEADPLPLEIRNEIPELVPRFSAITMRNVQVGPSPTWLVVELAKLGQRSINNIVDYTNYFMLLTGQPLHAYDYDKICSLDGTNTAHLTVRLPHDSERITLLNGKEINPRQQAIMIATDSQLIGLAGIMGGQTTEVDTATRNIILECANFDMYSVRRTSMEHGVFSEALTRFNKGQSPLQNLAVLARIVDEIRQFAGGTVASDVIDNNHVPAAFQSRGSLYPAIPITTGFINSRLGLNLQADQIKLLLENVEFQVSVESDNLTVLVPFWRTDVETREDVIEEVGRLQGFDTLPLTLPRRNITPATKNPLLELKSKVRTILAASGANELLTYSFVHGDLLQKAGQNKAEAYQISNALSPDLQYFRLSLTPSLLENVHPNSKAGYNEFALFEIGKGHNVAHSDKDGLPMEFEMLDFVYAAADKLKRPGAAFYTARKFLIDLAANLGLELELKPIEQEEDYSVAKPYDHTRSASVWVKGSDTALGMIGEYKANVRRQLKLPVFSAGFGLGLSQLLAATTSANTNYVALPRFPKITQDITLQVPAGLAYQTLYDFVWSELAKIQPPQTLPSLGPVAIYQDKTDTTHKRISFRLTIASYQKTLRDSEVMALLDTVAAEAQERFGAVRI